MPTVTKLRIRGLKSRHKVTLYAREGTYALSVPNSRLGWLLLPFTRQNPIMVKVKPPVELKELPRGVKPVRKTAPKMFTYVRLTKKRVKSRSKKKGKNAQTIVPPTGGATNKGKNKNKQKAAIVV